MSGTRTIAVVASDEHLARYTSRDAAMASLGIEAVEAARGRAVTSMVADTRWCDERGVLSRGPLFTLADAAMALASNSYGAVALLVHADATWYADAPAGSRLTARCTVVERSARGEATLESRVITADGDLIGVVWGMTRELRG